MCRVGAWVRPSGFSSAGSHSDVQCALLGIPMWVKICGIRDEATAEQISRLSPDAIGLNFYEKSPRSVRKDVATRIAGVTGDTVQRVGVFVNHSASEIADLVHECRLGAVQLHGDETAEEVAKIASQLPGIPLFRAWRMAGESLADLEQHLADCSLRGIQAASCLIDSRVPGAYGGTGHAVPWEPLRRVYQHDKWPSLILAGGLTADNVVEAIQAVKPWGVDVASGVESAPGQKDLEQVRRFIENARRA